MSGSFAPPIDPDFEQKLRDAGLWEETTRKLNEAGCSNWRIFCTLEEEDIDGLDIRKLQKPSLKRLLRDAKANPDPRQSCSGSSERPVNVDVEKSKACYTTGWRSPPEAGSPPIGSVTVKVKDSHHSRTVGVDTTENTSPPLTFTSGQKEDGMEVEEAGAMVEEAGAKMKKDSTNSEMRRDSAAIRGKKRNALEEELFRYKAEKRQRQDEAGEEASDPASYNFGRKKKRALDVGYMMTVFKEAPYSVGMIMHTDSHIGTGFRVGNDFLMTCQHVVSGVNGLKVKFNHISSLGSDEIIVMDIKETVYRDDALDVAILKIAGAGLLNSKPLQLCSDAMDGPVCFLGHPGFGNNTPMMLDTGIEMIHLDDIKKDAGKVVEYHETLLQRCNSHEDPHVVFRNCGMGFQGPMVSWDGILDDNFRIIHTAFLSGAPGSPGVQVDEAGRVRVRLMLCRGFPRFYQELTDEGRALHPMPSEKLRFEHGLDMNRLYLKMCQWVREVPSDSEFYANRQQFLGEIFG